MTKKGMALPIFMPDPSHLLVVKGRKTEDMVITYAKSYQRDLPGHVKRALDQYNKVWARSAWPERVQFFRSRASYCVIRDWVNAERSKRADVPNTKRDRLALVGGEVLPNEFVDHPDDYGEWACAREFVEESGLVIVDEATKENLFHFVERHWSQDFDSPPGNITYENVVYWITEARSKPDENGNMIRDTKGFPLPRDRGVQGETFAAFYIEIDRLTKENFHWKHAHVVRSALLQKVAAGHEEYRPALEHFEQFPEITSLYPEPSVAPEVEEEPASLLSEADEFAQAMAGVTPIAS